MVLMDLWVVGLLIGWLLVTALIGFAAGALLLLPWRRNAAVGNRWRWNVRGANSSDASRQMSKEERATIASLSKVVAQLTAQLEERQRLKEESEKLQQLLGNKDTEIAALLERVVEAETTTRLLEEQEAARLQGAEAFQQVISSYPESEGGWLDEVVSVLEPVVEQAETVAKLKEIEAAVSEKESEIASLTAQVREQEAVIKHQSEDANLRELDARFQSTLTVKEAEISRLRLLVNQLTPFSTLIADRDRRIREMTNQHQATLKMKDAEIKRLEEQLKTVGSSNGHRAAKK